MHAIAHRGCVNTLHWKLTQTGRKIPLLHQGIKPTTVLHLAFQPDTPPTELANMGQHPQSPSPKWEWGPVCSFKERLMDAEVMDMLDTLPNPWPYNCNSVAILRGKVCKLHPYSGQLCKNYKNMLCVYIIWCNTLWFYCFNLYLWLNTVRSDLWGTWSLIPRLTPQGDISWFVHCDFVHWTSFFQVHFRYKVVCAVNGKLIINLLRKVKLQQCNLNKRNLWPLRLAHCWLIRLLFFSDLEAVYVSCLKK